MLIYWRVSHQRLEFPGGELMGIVPPKLLENHAFRQQLRLAAKSNSMLPSGYVKIAIENDHL